MAHLKFVESRQLWASYLEGRVLDWLGTSGYGGESRFFLPPAYIRKVHLLFG